MTLIFVAAAVLAILLFGIFVMFASFYKKVEQGKALIVNTLRSEPDVTFTGRMVYPIIHIKEYMDISLRTVEIDRSGSEGLICKDNIRADIKVKFFVRVNKTAQDVLKVAQNVGCARASDQETLENLFSAKFSEALKTVGKQMEFIELYGARDKFRDEIVRQIGDDLAGYVLEDAAIDFLEQTPLDKLDGTNILDAQGIKKITELTAVENVRTNELRRNEQMQIKKKDVETRETILELERQQAEAEARQAREITSVRAREGAEGDKVKAEEHAKAEVARLQSEQLIGVQNENATRETQVAEQNRLRAVAIEVEKVTRARQLEIVDREKEVTLQTIDKDRAVEVQKKAIADVIRERIIVERTVAEQEEAIKDVRVVADAERTRRATVIHAEGQASEKLILAVKDAEADEKRAVHKAQEELTIAEARLRVAEKAAEGKKREAEGLEAIAAAPGFAQAKVAMANADAFEKQGLVDAKVKIAAADAVSKYGIAEAEALRAKMTAEADGQEKIGLAGVQIKTADADAVSKQGEAEAHVIETRFNAEAKGLREKFDAMKAMGPETRAHEETRIRLQNAHVETMKTIEAQEQIAERQADVLAKAVGNAKIDIVGGDGSYFEKFIGALAIGKGIDGAIDRSRTLQLGLKEHLAGDRNLIDDLENIAGAFGRSADELQNLSVAGLLAKVAKDGTETQKNALKAFVNGTARA